MAEPHRPRIKYVIGPNGCRLTIADLPTPGTTRWVIRRKAEVVAAVRGGLLSLEEACSRYTLAVEEFLSWQYSIDQHGLAGLRTTRIQQYRQVPRVNLQYHDGDQIGDRPPSRERWFRLSEQNLRIGKWSVCRS
jgi:Protein of unknown function (DUF1153)